MLWATSHILRAAHNAIVKQRHHSQRFVQRQSNTVVSKRSQNRWEGSFKGCRDDPSKLVFRVGVITTYYLDDRFNSEIILMAFFFFAY